MCQYFFSQLILGARERIQKYFHSFFCSYENFKICFWDQLTFSMDSMYVRSGLDGKCTLNSFSIQFVGVVFDRIMGLQANSYHLWLKKNFGMKNYTLFWISLENLPIEMQKWMHTCEIWRNTKAYNSISVHYQRRYIVVE